MDASRAEAFQADEGRFERQSDLGVHGDRGREAYGRADRPWQEEGSAGRGGPNRGALRRDRPHQGPRGEGLGPYQDSWALGTGRRERGLADPGGGAQAGGRGYAAVAGGGHRAPGGRRGRGPAGQRRSDHRILEDICERLTDDAYVDASDIDVQVLDGTITLGGTVAERWEKHRAEDIADACSGVRQIENRIRVSPSREAPGAGGGSERASRPVDDAAPRGPGTRADRGEIGNSG